MKRIVSVSLGPSSADYEFTTTFLGHEFHVRRLGADWKVDRAEKLLKKHAKEADAIGISMVRDHAVVGTHRYTDPLTSQLEAVVEQVPVTTGCDAAEPVRRRRRAARPA